MRPIFLSAIIVGVAAFGVAAADAAPTKSAESTTQPTAVERYSYPGADRIFQERNIRLKTGDGHIVLASCGSVPNMIEVWRTNQDKYCFQVSGNKGHLTLELPEVYLIKGNDYRDIEATLTTPEERSTLKVQPNTWTPVPDPVKKGPRTLVELTASR